ncbi:hypothetical protein FMUND_13856 [Fusarium mundagurra]|uniref:Uncharacterized protein n=1 Tax=Fusarium mundagurra TaxID=1567541 RepID=A0A8H5XXN9_9HYPO|nr:hypothetical protein FMUND_13856 [Fusarium mundagurra]
MIQSTRILRTRQVAFNYTSPSHTTVLGRELLQYLNEHELAILEELKSCDISKTDNTVPRVVVYKSIETDEEEAGWNAEENDTMEEAEDEINIKPEEDNSEGWRRGWRRDGSQESGSR